MKEKLKPTDKWCPMARLVIPSDSPTDTEPVANRFCVGVGMSTYWDDVRCLGENCAVFIGTDADGHCGLIHG